MQCISEELSNSWVCPIVSVSVCVCLSVPLCWQSVSSLISHVLWLSRCESGADPVPAGDRSALCDLMLMMGTCMCESIYLLMSVHALTYTRSSRDTLYHSLHSDSLILLALLPADCDCSLQAGLTFLFHHLLVYEVTPVPSDKLACTCLNSSCLCSQLTEKETSLTMLSKIILLTARK